MTDTPSLWALDRAAKECGYKDWGDATFCASNTSIKALTLAARYIEAHEAPPVDPVLQVALDAVHAWEKEDIPCESVSLYSPEAINRPDVVAAANVIRAYIETLKGDVK